ncbi:TPA: hypothetical protein N0F65_003334 [Lagenidium giganteum]|uniref:Uncharacterized protein n=1 Tax=Lagenidium giganteum TaxID=4803 RepID=A0AAV2ZCK0_9STRA|nr:TPA: hypothetical protein N0F65_003334 [Lagenidium giganteum]
MTREQVLRRVYNTRRKHFGRDIHGRVELPPLAMVKDSSQYFFQFQFSYYDKTKPNLERLIGWAHTELIGLLKYRKTTILLDGTFRCVPRGLTSAW